MKPWNVPKTTPISSVKDLRPISVTPVLSRLVERLVVRDYLLPCIPSENLVDQYAYKLTGNTTCAIINITDTVGRMLESNRYVRCLLLDFSKAFDTVDHLLLLQNCVVINYLEIFCHGLLRFSMTDHSVRKLTVFCRLWNISIEALYKAQPLVQYHFEFMLLI